MKNLTLILAFLSCLLVSTAYAQADEIMTFAINGWTPGSATPLALNNSSTLTTNINFYGCPNYGSIDGSVPGILEVKGYYNIYLTLVGNTYPTTSILIGSHVLDASNYSTSDPGLNPWNVSLDGGSISSPPACAANTYNFAAIERFCSNIPSGSYQVDIVVTGYFINETSGANGGETMGWQADANNVNTLSSFTAPTAIITASDPTALTPASSYLFSKIALVNFTASATPITLSIPPTYACGTASTSATVTPTIASGCPPGSFTYHWSNSQTTQTATGLTAGNTYTVTATAPSGTTGTASITIGQTGPVTASLPSTVSVCTSASTASATVTPVTAAGCPASIFTYHWSNGQTTQTATGLVLGNTYTVTVTSLAGTTATASISVVNRVSTVINGSLFYTCKSGETVIGPTETAVPSGGASPYSYLWHNTVMSGTSTGASVSTVIPWNMTNTYTVTVTDANSCTATASVLLSCVHKELQANNSDVNFNIYPNPSQGLINLHIDGVVMDDALISVIDITGRKVYESTFHLFPGFEPIINLAHLPKGIYIVVAHINDQSYTKRLTLD